MIAATRNDALRLMNGSDEILSMRVWGAIPGVIVTAAAANNGTGIGTLRGTGTSLAWTAPGSDIEGVAQVCAVDGEYILEDGEDATKWLRVQVYTTYLSNSASGKIVIENSFNVLGPSDISAAQATVGNVATVTYTLKNASNNYVYNVKLWLDPACAAGITISSDGVNYYSPTTSGDAHVLAWSSVAPGASVSVYIKRTISAGASSNVGLLNILQYQWSSLN